ncbi:MAG: patatin-like phospholipase family protein [Treponema sp.]|jgi:NTE family protein|nr:patatin-like phospholipase family protein [Treponema sp.]
MKINKKLKYALALSGGGARGLVHVGVLRALEETGFPPPSLIAGTSMGAIVGGLYASGMKGPALSRYVLEELDVPGFMESPVFKLDGPLGKLFQTGRIIGNIATKTGFDSGKKVWAILERLTGGKKIEDCEIPFLCNAVDLGSGRELIFRSGSLSRAIRASMAFPVVFEPLVEGDLCMVDGGIADNLPVKSAREAGRDLGIKRVLAVDTRRWRNLPPAAFKNGISVVMRCFEAMVHVSETEPAVQPRRAGRAFPPVLMLHAADRTSVLDFSRKKQLLELGRDAVYESQAALGAFFGGGVKAALARRSLSGCGIQTDAYYGDA